MEFSTKSIFMLPFFCCCLLSVHGFNAKTFASRLHDAPADKTQTFINLSKKLKGKEVSNASQTNADNQESVESEASSPMLSDSTKILIGLGTVGIVAAALVWAQYRRLREEIQRTAPPTHTTRTTSATRPEAPQLEEQTVTERRENERLWREAEERVRHMPPPPPAPAELHGPEIRTVADIQPDPFYWDTNPERQGQCLICLNDREDILHLHNGLNFFCRDCLLTTVLTAYNNARPNFDRISPSPGTTLTREDIRNITHNNARMLNAFDIAAYHRLHVDPQAQLANVTPELRSISRPCPRCIAPIQKASGCRHMTCRCGHEFCWFCSQDCFLGLHHYPDCGRH